MNFDECNVGMSVRCEYEDHHTGNLQQNKIYTVAETSISSGTIRLNEAPYWYKPWRFSKVVSVDNSGS